METVDLTASEFSFDKRTQRRPGTAPLRGISRLKHSRLPCTPSRLPSSHPLSSPTPPFRLRPAFSINAFPLFSSIIESKSENPPKLPSHIGLSEKTLSRIVQARSVEKFLLVRRGQRTIDYSRNQLNRKNASQTVLLDSIC